MKRKIIVMYSLLLLFGLVACGSESNATTEEKKDVASTEVKNDSQKEGEKKKNKEAKKIDESLWDITTKIDASYGKLINEIQKFSDENADGDVLSLYDMAKYVDDDFFLYFRESNDIDFEGVENYKECVQLYISNCQLLTENLMKYIDKSEMKYLSEAKNNIEDTSKYTTQLIAARMKFLSDNGYTDKEIQKILE